MKHESTTSLGSQIGNQLSGLQPAGESCPKRPKMQTSAGKVLASVFWNAQAIFVEKGRTLNSEYYTALLVHLKEEVARKEEKKCSFTKTMHHVTSQSQQ